jgi:hypothetical protein
MPARRGKNWSTNWITDWATNWDINWVTEVTSPALGFDKQLQGPVTLVTR